MGPAEPGELSRDGLERVEAEVSRFERLCEERRDVRLRGYWDDRCPRAPLDRDERLVCLTSLIKSDLRRRFERGEPTAAASYLEEFPELRQADSRVVSLVYEEFCLREEGGEVLDVERFCDRYPEWKDSLIAQLGYHRLLSQAAGLGPPRPRFPAAGGDFEEFELLQQIGRGGYSRVFLARDRSLGGKRVVLKVSVDCGREAEAQGALDHPHIVPVNSVVYQPDEGLRGLSMPYRPGLPLDEVIRRVGGPQSCASARSIWEALASGVREAPPCGDGSDEIEDALRAGPGGDGWRGFPSGGGFEQGVAWIALILARALAYAHERRTYHRDVKPGNVLLTIQHGPQLLDFNLAKSPHSPEEAQSAFQGGTLPYMAPEQIEAFLDPTRWEGVGAAADIYSVGLMLREMLTGRPLDVPDANLPPPRALRELLDRRSCLTADIRRYNPKVPHALEAIVAKCLRLDPAQRYASGGELAEDLERFLARRPPAHTINPSRLERARDWGARNRRLLVVNACYLAILALLAPLAYRQVSLRLLPELEERQEFHQAVRAFNEGSRPGAFAALTRLAAEHPSSPLPGVYLAIARFEESDAIPDPFTRDDFEEAMRLPNAAAAILAWGAEHRELADALSELGSAYQNRALELSRNKPWLPESSSGRELPDLTADPAIRRLVDLADAALSCSLALKPEAKRTIQAMATVDEMRGALDSAEARLTGLLQDSDAPGSATPGDLISWRLQRARVITRRAWARLCDSARPEAPTEAGQVLGRAFEDLSLCGRAQTREHEILYHGLRTEALLARGHLHCLKGDRARRDADRREAQVALNTWFHLLQLSGQVFPATVEDGYRARLRNLQACDPAAEVAFHDHGR